MTLYVLSLIGIAAFSITGVLAAGKRGMDIFSIVILGVVTALGGGTLRDVILNQVPVFWIADFSYFWVALASSVASFFLVRFIRRTYQVLLFVDAFGLALFTVLATQRSIHAGYALPVAVVMGLITGVVGGMIRDILTGKMPLLMGRDFYATPAFLGAALLAVLSRYFPEHAFNTYYAIAVIFCLRAAAIQWDLYYPRWLIYGREDTE